MSSAFFLSVIVVGLSLLSILARYFFRICDAANGADWGNAWLNRLDGFNRLFCRYFHGLKFNQLKLPTHGSGIVVANHVSGLDPLLMIAATPRPLRFMIAREQYNRFGLKWLFRAIGCIPVDREKNPKRVMRDAVDALERGEMIALFPQGGIELDQKKMYKLKVGAVRLAKLANCALYPMRIKGINKWSLGHTVLSVLIPSSAEIESFEPIDCANQADRKSVV